MLFIVSGAKFSLHAILPISFMMIFPNNLHVLLLMDLLVFLNFSQCSLHNLHINPFHWSFSKASAPRSPSTQMASAPGIVILMGAANLAFDLCGDCAQEPIHSTCSVFPMSGTPPGSAVHAQLWSLPQSGLWSFIQFSILYRQATSKAHLNYLHKWSYTSVAIKKKTLKIKEWKRRGFKKKIQEWKMC